MLYNGEYAYTPFYVGSSKGNKKQNNKNKKEN